MTNAQWRSPLRDGPQDTPNSRAHRLSVGSQLRVQRRIRLQAKVSGSDFAIVVDAGQRHPDLHRTQEIRRLDFIGPPQDESEAKRGEVQRKHPVQPALTCSATRGALTTITSVVTKGCAYITHNVVQRQRATTWCLRAQSKIAHAGL